MSKFPTKTSVTVSGQATIHMNNELPFDEAVARTLAAGYTPVITHRADELFQGYRYIDGQGFLVTHVKKGKE